VVPAKGGGSGVSWMQGTVANTWRGGKKFRQGKGGVTGKGVRIQAREAPKIGGEGEDSGSLLSEGGK